MASIVPLALGMKLMGVGFKVSKQFKTEIYNPDLDFRFNITIQMTTVDGKANIWMTFKDGKMSSGMGKTSAPDLTIVYRDKTTMAGITKNTPDDSLDLLLSGGMSIIGNMVALAKFSYLTTIFPKKINRPDSKGFPPKTSVNTEQAAVKRIKNIILDRKVDAVQNLEDPFLGRLSIADFPRLLKMKDELFSAKPEVCTERARHLTAFFRAEGFERKPDGSQWDATQRNGYALRHVLVTKAPRIFDGDLLPGSTTSKKLGVQLFPEFGATLIWPELRTVQSRALNPYVIDAADAKLLNEYVFPFWIDRNIREYTRNKYKNPMCQRFDDNFVLYFMWKTQAISHTIPNWETLLSKGISGIIGDLDRKSKDTHGDPGATAFYDGTRAALEGIITYAGHLLAAVEEQVTHMKGAGISSARLRELETIARILHVVPAIPACTFQEAITSIWIVWTSLHNENMNAGLSLGRLDQVLYPYFENDMKLAKTEAEQGALVRSTIELVGHFYLKCGDHLPLVPSVGNKLFGGSSSDQALTLGGVTPGGKNAVNDLTYIFLKVTEMLTIRDPNVNARYHPGINSTEYLSRLCEVNINTTSTPSIHNDEKMIEALVNRGFKIEDARNWAATGCVEPTVIGKHFGHTNSMLLNLIAPLEILMNNGRHPLLHYAVSPGVTPDFIETNYHSFDDVLNGYKAQLAYLIAKSIEINNLYGTVHQEIKPTPLLSSMIDGPLDRGKDITFGTARYNTSGVALVAMVDVVDSLLAIKKVIFDWKKITIGKFKEALDRNFCETQDKILLEHIKNVPKFGSNDVESNALTRELIDFTNQEYGKTKNYRGGDYLVGFWSMSNHTAFGKLSGTMPSGRLKGKAFTPGITPSPGSSDQLLDNIKSVAALDSNMTPNNIAFNVKLVPFAGDTHDETVDHFTSYAKSYLDMGGLQMQFNVVTSEMLRDAMRHPDRYRWLMVRISGYNAYFIELNVDMQVELIERMEFKA